MSALFFLPCHLGANALSGEEDRPTASLVMGFVSPPLTLYRLCSYFAFRVLEPGSRSCQVRGVRKTGHKTAQGSAPTLPRA